jgi:hypothetical protein
MAKKQQYNYEYLQKFCEEKIIHLDCDYSKEKITRETIIRGKCKSENCNGIFEKTFRSLNRSNSYYCEECIKKIRMDKIYDTNLKKYGCKISLQNKEVKQKQENTLLTKYGIINPSQSQIFQNKKIETFNKKYGVNNPSQSQLIKNKKMETANINYGVNYPLQNKEIKDKIKNTCLEKYSVECVFQNKKIKEKIKNTLLDKYGIINPSQSQIFQNKKIETNVKNWGVEHPSQNKEYMDKISNKSFKIKDYILPSGNILKIQGYEHYALDELLKVDGILEEDIVNGCSNVPEIWYNDEAGKKHRHYVDIFIPSQNRMVEVKSTWTAEKKKDNIFLKQEAGKQLGYLYEIWIYDNKGNKIEIL